MTAILSILFQVADSFFNFPTGFDVIASIAEDWLEAYRAIQKMKIV